MEKKRRKKFGRSAAHSHSHVNARRVLSTLKYIYATLEPIADTASIQNQLRIDHSIRRCLWICFSFHFSTEVFWENSNIDKRQKRVRSKASTCATDGKTKCYCKKTSENRKFDATTHKTGPAECFASLLSKYEATSVNFLLAGFALISMDRILLWFDDVRPPKWVRIFKSTRRRNSGNNSYAKCRRKTFVLWIWMSILLSPCSGMLVVLITCR